MITTTQITETVKQLCIDVNYYLSNDCVASLKSALKKEKSRLAKDVLNQMINNVEIASDEKIPICQDTGIAVLFVEIGQNARIAGGSITDAINDGVKQGYADGYLRKSVVEDPLNRINIKTNAPAIIHYDIVPGDKIKISLTAKGAGSENMSQIRMFTPSAAIEEIENFIVKVVKDAGSKPCPPVIIGVGIGGNFEKSAILSKKAILRNIGSKNSNMYYAEMEKRVLKKVNELGIGPMGVGGKTTALAVFIESYPCHIASLPVSVNIQCWVARHKSRTLFGE